MSTLIHFTGGGPLDGLTYPQAQIFGEEKMLAGADQYADTATVKVSEKNPNLQARVWRWKEQTIPMTNQEKVPNEKVAQARLDLQNRREAVKASRALVAERAGLAPSKVAAIENGTGKRIKPEEVEALETTLAALEQEAAARAHD